MAGNRDLENLKSRLETNKIILGYDDSIIFWHFLIKIKVREQRGPKKLNLIQIMRGWLDIGLLKKFILVL